MRRSRAARDDLVVVLNYYSPYVSGLTMVARQIAEGCAARGWRVRVVTSRYDPALPAREVLNGVTVERTRVIARVRNGVVSPTFPVIAFARARRARATNLHLPMLEAGPIALARRRSTVVTYECDYLTGDATLLGRIIRRVIDASSRLAACCSAGVVVTSEDYAEASRVYPALRGRLWVIAPPYTDRSGGSPTFRQSPGLHVGTLGRVVHEKGLDVLVRAFRRIPDADALLLIAGHYAQVAGPSVIDELRRLAAGDDRIQFLGYLPDEQVADFLASLDVFVFPSVNALEAYGIAQLEAISAGVPVVASDLPGVRLPVTRSGFGVLVPPGDVDALHDAIRHVAATSYTAPLLDVPDAIEEYVRLFEELAGAAGS